MTDSSSEQPIMVDMAADMMSAKMDAAKMTHLLRIGTFQMEISPNEDIDVRAFFNETIDKLIKAYGDRLLEIDIRTSAQPMGGMHQ
jgi:hypothetical protein|tara:strand:- start:446 stop:703 length:258 start_codon:yes stop_codon:yes gene_type:complete